MTTLRAAFKLTLFMLLNVFITLTQGLFVLFYKGPASYIVPQFWQRCVCRIFGITVIVEGTPVTDKQVIFVSNHISYLDIPVIGSILRASFVAKAEVAAWPLFGYLSTLQQTAFLNRARTATATGRNTLQDMLDKGKNLIVFPEGTSTNGTDVLPFKSSLFSIMFGQKVKESILVQPVTITPLEIDGREITSPAVRDIYAWHGDMTLAPHLWAFAKARGAKIVLRFHPPRMAKDYTDRKIMAQTCHDDVLAGLTIDKPNQGDNDNDNRNYTGRNIKAAGLPSEHIR